MTIKDLLEIIILVIGGGGAAASGGFAWATNKYSIQLLKHTNNLENLQLEIKTQNLEATRQNFEVGRKIQKNIDHLTTEFGVVKCDVRDIKAVLINQGLIHDRAGFPEENIPKRTGWTIEDA